MCKTATEIDLVIGNKYWMIEYDDLDAPCKIREIILVNKEWYEFFQEWNYIFASINHTVSAFAHNLYDDIDIFLTKNDARTTAMAQLKQKINYYNGCQCRVEGYLKAITEDREGEEITLDNKRYKLVKID